MAISTHSGGAADKAGYFHESLWAVRCMMDVIDGNFGTIRIETPGDDGAEFNLQCGKVCEHWQAKRQVTGQGTWSFEKLKDVLKFFFGKFRVGDRCVFASVSDAPELRMLTENAQASAGNLDQFTSHFVDKKRAKQFEELKILVGATSDQEALDFLCTVVVHGGREITLEREFGYRLQVLFNGPWTVTMAVMRDLYLQSTHETLTGLAIEQHLRSCGIMRRRGVGPDARDCIHNVTRAYLEGLRAKLIRGSSIPRLVAADVAAKILSGSESFDFLFTGPAGVGKSACLCQVVERLEEAGIPVFAFRLDRIEPVPTARLLGEKLGVSESPALALAEAFVGQTVVLVVDQLDCVSTTSGRHPDFFDTVAALRAEVFGLRSKQRFHLVFACRKFDFEHDYRLKQFQSKDQPLIELGEFSPEEVSAVLQQEGGNASTLTARQQSMLRLPQNLSLFVDSGLARTENRFSTPKDLCDAYWDYKSRAVSRVRPEFAQYWFRAIADLTRTMSERQQLSVPHYVMDAYPLAFLDSMASEGVLTRDEKRYGFGHETFFDYCFARTLPNEGRDFIKFLEDDSQHLFRRAQLRQVLAFRRDVDFEGYCSSISELLSSMRIRPHLKLLVVELVAAHPHARGEELHLLMPAIELELACRAESRPNTNNMASRIWDRFFASRTLFVVADEMGLISSWLHSGQSWLQEMVLRYFHWQTAQHADRVAELLEPFVEQVEWRFRLRGILDGHDLEKSRNFFSLFLRLHTNGGNEETEEHLASSGPTWSTLYMLAERRPDWFAELVGRWIERQIAVGSTAQAFSLKSEVLNGFEVDDLIQSANANPMSFLTFVLPAVLNAAAAFVFDGDPEEFRHDSIWPVRFRNGYVGSSDALLEACATALCLIGKSSPEILEPFTKQLRSFRLYTANRLLMTSYLSNPAIFADEAIQILADEASRLRCGYSDNAYDVARLVIEKCSPHCAVKIFRKLENVVVAYISRYERTGIGMFRRGNAAYILTSGLDQSRLSAKSRALLLDWSERFEVPNTKADMIWHSVDSPIEESAAKCMSDEHWLGAMAKYNTEDRKCDYRKTNRGAAYELSGVLQKFTQDQPERFAELALRLPENCHPYYFSHILRGLHGAAISSQLKLMAVRRVFGLDHPDCIHSALNLLASLTDIELPDDAVDFIRLVAAHPDPRGELWDTGAPNFGSDIMTYGLNTMRGYAADTISKLVAANPGYLTTFFTTIEELLTDPIIAVRAWSASILFPVAQHDVDLALRWSDLLLDADDRLLTTHAVERFIHQGLPEHFERFSGTIYRMLNSSYGKVREVGGKLACLARLYHKHADGLAVIALEGDTHTRLGACEVAKSNLLASACRPWCEATLAQLFSDENLEVRRKATGCFWHLWRSPDTPLTDFDNLIRCFIASKSFVDGPINLLHALDETKYRAPEAVLDVCEVFILRCSENVSSFRASEMIVGKLVFTAYAQMPSEALRIRALNVIDQMNLKGLTSIMDHLNEFER